eukprot:7763310-Pyramimonas_sp.AAC.1
MYVCVHRVALPPLSQPKPRAPTAASPGPGGGPPGAATRLRRKQFTQQVAPAELGVHDAVALSYEGSATTLLDTDIPGRGPIVASFLRASVGD